MTDNDVWNMVIRWIAAKSGKQTIATHEGGTEPPEPYITVNFLSSDNVRDNEQLIEYEDADTSDMETGDLFPPVIAKPKIEKEWQFSVHAYGSTPTDLLRPILSAARIPQVLEPIEPEFTLFTGSEIRRIPEYIKNAWRHSAQLDVFVRGITSDGFKVDVINDSPFEIVPDL